MLVRKKKYNKLKDDYNWLVDTKNNIDHCYNQMKSNNDTLEQRINRLEKELEKAADEVLDLKLERDTYNEKYEECWLKFIKTKEELDRVDRIVLQYEQRINELEEQLNETTI